MMGGAGSPLMLIRLVPHGLEPWSWIEGFLTAYQSRTRGRVSWSL